MSVTYLVEKKYGLQYMTGHGQVCVYTHVC